ncbi:MAG: methyltransferase domain-containing protein [Gracilibacteraceae bacterium]|jgi:23S rRNA (guanine745-N1)-methyltransferase|nr:methyltransferase domain-containing protein [Gracilibacteraceae bacterium]
MKAELLAFWNRAGGLLQCPVCAQPGEIRAGSFVCFGGHCFDLAARGYLNFLPRRAGGPYDAALFQSRRAVYGRGFFAPVLERLAEIVRSAGRPELTLLDAGCGEGYFAGALAQASDLPSLTALALDIAPEAIRLAARTPGVYWLVADLSRMPLRAGIVDVLLNILTPANYTEFARVLAPGGLAVKIIPGPDHLREIRAAAGKAPYAAPPVKEIFAGRLALAGEEEMRYTLPATPEEAEHFLRMTPLTQDGRPSALAAPREVTVHLILLRGRKI